MLSMSMIERIIPEMAAKRLRELIITFALTKLFLEVFSAAAARSDPETMYYKQRGAGRGEGQKGEEQEGGGAEGERQKR